LANYLDTVDSDWFKQRLTRIIVSISLVFVLLISRLLYLQVIEGREYRRLSEINSIRLRTVDAPRGLIFDRNGKLLVDNRPSFDLAIIPKDARPVEETVAKLSALIEVPSSQIMARLREKRGRASYKPVLIKSDIGRHTLAAVEVLGWDLPGVIVKISPRRDYIYPQSAAHLLGYLGEIGPSELGLKEYQDCKGGDFIGKYGVEKSYARYLRGKRGGRQVEVNATGQVVRTLKTVDAKPGKNIYLTIDHTLQARTEKLMAEYVGAIVALEPSTGQILAMVSAPAFNQNAFISGMSSKQWQTLVTNPHRPLENKVLQAEYPPASTYKIVTAIAALEEGIIDQHTEFHCPGHLWFGDRAFRCWRKGGHGDVNLVQALAQSCDVYFYHVGLQLGIERLAWYAKAFGLGDSTGLDLGHEADGLVPTADWKKRRTGIAWQEGETLTIAIGQGYNLATPLQMAHIIGAVANDGVRIAPSIVRSIKEADHSLVWRSEPKIIGHLPVSEKNLAIIKKGLFNAVNHIKGTAWEARIEGLHMCGKTGTAQVVGRKNDDEKEKEDVEVRYRPHAWFVAYAPVDEPKIAVAVIVEHGEHGSSTAAPLAAEVIKTYLNIDEETAVQASQGEHTANTDTN
jgi:penicillin-binding protein 2